MENKTKEQLLDKYIKDKHSQDECSGWIDGWDARQPEIDALKETIKELSKQLTCIIKTQLNKQNHE